MKLSANIRIGVAGWQYPDWNGVFYPARRPRGFDALVYTASYFNLIEVNSTFYRIPRPEIARSWAERVAAFPDFQFTAKAHRDLTHSSSAPEPRLVDSFVCALAPLAEAGRLRRVLIQFPWSFRDGAPARTRILELHRMLGPLPLTVELRHGSWTRDDAPAWLASEGVNVCRVDQPLVGDAIGPDVSLGGGGTLYARLHGRNARQWFARDAGRDARYNYLYSQDELSPWLAVILAHKKSGTEAIVVLNNHFRGQAPANAFEMMAALSGETSPAPRELRAAYPHLREVTRGDRNTDPPTLFGGVD